tara:strand:- start:68 stop:424 length:357 start_codon:yes stop_codon:yes gene_type:complete
MELLQRILGKSKRQIQRDRRKRQKEKAKKKSLIQNIKRDIDFRKDMMGIKENFTYKMRPSEKKIDKQILKNQKKNLFRVRMGGASQDIFNIDMPKPDIPKQKQKIKLQHPHALWKLIP